MTYCHPDVIDVKYLQDYELYLIFQNGTRGHVDISKIIPFKGVFENTTSPPAAALPLALIRLQRTDSD